ncbi:hypothetical protein HOF56_02520 [Candidatus Peribacteria bacterium]|jgi:hypothetical protein|nr:hypothetical protein [Candidatus Peribacteria bacterium]MBT4021330.1 hypothetical protein [Candidatus Peribacteria bacterium]MBT4241209.1 hypothetical protein [Candidatus Peribacteria bacterium]MBT4474234.1 hypothetical protein [Candidatus Peribacteria bacterium]
MSELGGVDIFGPEEDGKVSEALSEEAKERFAASAKAMKQLKRDEKRAKKKDTQVAQTIIQFLNSTSGSGGDDGTKFFVLISKLVANNCPSIFILGILSLINEECQKVVQEYFEEHEERSAHEIVDENMALVKGQELQKETNRKLIDWITCLQMILTHDPEKILDSLMLDDKHLDGSVLQLTIFVLQDFFEKKESKTLPYEKAQPLTASILQTIFDPFLKNFKKPVLGEGEKEEE